MAMHHCITVSLSTSSTFKHRNDNNNNNNNESITRFNKYEIMNQKHPSYPELKSNFRIELERVNF